MRHPRAYGTAAHTGAFSESKEIAVVIYENGKKLTTNDSNDPIVLQQTGLHYDLLLLRRLRRKTRL